MKKQKPHEQGLSVPCGGESGIRTRGGLAPSPVFKTGAFIQLDHLSIFETALTV
jgi:hypothetical protein